MKEKMFSRTIKAAVYKVEFVDREKRTFGEYEVIVPLPTSPRQVKLAVEAQRPHYNAVVMQYEKISTIGEKYEMTITEFVRHARKVGTTTADEAEEMGELESTDE